MAVAFVAQASASVATAVANVTVNKSDLEPGGNTLQVNDVLIAVAKANSTTSTWSGTGFTAFAQNNTSASSAVLYRVVDGSEGSTFTLTRSSNTAAAELDIIRFSGVDTTTPLEAADFFAGSGSVVLPSLTVSGANRLLFQNATRMVALAGQSWTQPGTATKRFDVTAATNNLQTAGGDETVSSGTTGTRTWTQSGTGAVRGAIFTLIPASGPPAGTGSLSGSGTLSYTAKASASGSGALSGSGSLTTPVSTAAALASFYTAVANANTNPVNIGMIGASLVEGFPCTADKTIQQYLAERFRADYPITGSPHGYGYMGLPSSAMVGINPWTITPGTGGSVGTASPANGWGGKHQVWFSGPLALSPILVLDLSTLDNLGAWTSFDMNITRSSTYSTTGGKYRIDGGSWVTFSLQAASGVSVDKIHVASAVTSTLEITIDSAATGSFVIVDGVVGYSGDESRGFQVHGYGHAGYKVSQWQVDANPTYGYRYDQVLQDHDLLILQDLGVNDAQSQTSATFQTNLTAWIDYLKAVHTCPMVMIAVQDLSSSVTYVEPWANYVAVMRNTAQTYGMPFLDYAGTIPTPPNATYYYSDNIHGNTNGAMYSLMADTIYNFIKPPTTAFTGSAGFSGSGSLSFSAPTPGPKQTAGLSGVGTLSLVGQKIVISTTAFTGAGSLSSVSKPGVLVSAGLSGTGQLSFTQTVAVSGSASLSGSGALSGAGKPIIVGTLGFGGAGSLTAVGSLSTAAAVNLSGSGTLGASGGLTTLMTVGLSGAGTLSAGGGSPNLAQTLGFSGAGSLSSVRVPGFINTAALSGAGSLTALGAPSIFGTTSFSGAGTLSVVAGTISASGSLSLSGSGTLAAARVYSILVSATGGTATGTGWTNPGNAAGADDSTYASWTSSTPNAVSSPLTVNNFGTWSSVPNGASVHKIKVRVKGYVSQV